MIEITLPNFITIALIAVAAIVAVRFLTPLAGIKSPV